MTGNPEPQRKPAPAKKAAPRLGDYELVSSAGGGASGKLYRARNTLLGTTVLLKTMPEAANYQDDVLKRFKREIRLAGQLSHPNLVKAHHAGCQGDVYYLVMEDVEGTDLSTLVKKNGPLPVDKAVEYVCQAATGLQHMHQQGVFHRNVKPSNLMLDAAGTVRVINLTSALVEENAQVEKGDSEELTVQGQILGTSDYMAPEQILDSHKADQRSDIYGLGCTLHFLITGRAPYEEVEKRKKLMAHLREPAPFLRQRCAEVTEALDQTFRKMLAKDPAERLQSMDEVNRELMASLFSGGGTLVREEKKFRWDVLAVGAVVGIVACGLIMLLWAALKP